MSHEIDKKTQALRVKVLTQNAYKPRTYEFDDSFRPYDPKEPLSVHTTAEMLECLENNPDIELEAKVLGFEGNQLVSKKIGRTKFQESFTGKNPWEKVKFRELDAFASDTPSSYTVGNDFTPLLGGAFFKNLYYYNDYIRMHSECFYAYHHDPIAKGIVQITRDFVIGSGYEVQCDDSTDQGKMAMAMWRAFEDANDFQHQIDQATEELSIYGEIMFWKLPNYQASIVYQLRPQDTYPVGMIPRVRLMDPSMFVEIVTYPEDITRALFYVMLVPTQWQQFTSGLGSDRPDSSTIQPTLKFIYQTVPAEQILHFKINSVSNEKRGRSDYFPVLSYLKRLRDSVDYSLIALQKTSAWAIDTTIKGDQTDIDNYVLDQAAQGTIPTAGSEFVHTDSITRVMQANVGSNNMNSEAFQLALSMICAGVGIPVSYMGTHLSGGQTKASALVGTEPVAKKMEKRRQVINRIVKQMWKYVMKCGGLPDIACDVIFPEIIAQDRSQKLKDLALAEDQRWISPSRAANMAAKEFQIQNYNYDKELADMKTELPEVPMPLSAPPQQGNAFGGSPSDDADASKLGVSGLTSEEKATTRFNDTHI